MKTSKEMKLKINDEIRENIEKDRPHCENIEIKLFTGTWSPVNGAIYLDEYEYRVNNTITINGIKIPKPLAKEDWYGYGKLYEPCSNNAMYRMTYKVNYPYYNCRSLLYSSASEAIEASKALFGIED